MTSSELKAQLASVTAVQDEIERLETTISKSRKAGMAGKHLKKLENHLSALSTSADELWAELKIGDTFSIAKEYGSDFMKRLLIVANLREYAMKKIVARFLVMSRLDQAAGGINPTLGTWYRLHRQYRFLLISSGTHVHQKLLSSLKSSGKSLGNIIDRYHKALEQLKAALPNGKSFPIPERFPKKLSSANAPPDIYSTVWTGDASRCSQGWLNDPSVRLGINARQVLDRCTEEAMRLCIEESRLLTWMKRESARIGNVIMDPSSKFPFQHATLTNGCAPDVRLLPFLREHRLRMETVASHCYGLTTDQTVFAAVILPAKKWPVGMSNYPVLAGPTVLPGSGSTASSATSTPTALHFLSRTPVLLDVKSIVPIDYSYAAHEVLDDADLSDESSSVDENGDPFAITHVGFEVDLNDEDDYSEAKPVDEPDAGGITFQPVHSGSASQRSAVVDTGKFDTPMANIAVLTRVRVADNGTHEVTVQAHDFRAFVTDGSATPAMFYAGLVSLLGHYNLKRDSTAILAPWHVAAFAEGGSNLNAFRSCRLTEFWNCELIVIPVEKEGSWSLALCYPNPRAIHLFTSAGRTSSVGLVRYRAYRTPLIETDRRAAVWQIAKRTVSACSRAWVCRTGASV